MKTFGIVLLLLTISGCASVELGRDFSLSQIEQKLQIGVTNKAAVRDVLGPPLSTGVELREGKRLEEWVYYSGAGTLPKLSDAKLKILQIRFGSDGMVESYNWAQ